MAPLPSPAYCGYVEVLLSSRGDGNAAHATEWQVSLAGSSPHATRDDWSRLAADEARPAPCRIDQA